MSDDMLHDGEEAARAWSQWYLGSPQWVDDIERARRNPERTWRSLAENGMEMAQGVLEDASAPPQRPPD